MPRRLLLLGAVLLAAGLPRAAATPYLVSYEADTPGSFPEDEGWERFITDGGALRTVEDGLFSLTAQNPSPNGGSDQYLFDREEMLNPDPGEFFFAEWRMRLLPGSDSADVGVVINTDGFERFFRLSYAVNTILSSGDNQQIFLDTTLFHSYRLESLDMMDYSMFIDGEWAWDGFFLFGTTRSSEVRFGDQSVGSASASEWDYFRFGVVKIPEPHSVFLFVLAWAVIPRRCLQRD